MDQRRPSLLSRYILYSGSDSEGQGAGQLTDTETNSKEEKDGTPVDNIELEQVTKSDDNPDETFITMETPEQETKADAKTEETKNLDFEENKESTSDETKEESKEKESDKPLQTNIDDEIEDIVKTDSNDETEEKSTTQSDSNDGNTEKSATSADSKDGNTEKSATSADNNDGNAEKSATSADNNDGNTERSAASADKNDEKADKLTATHGGKDGKDDTPDHVYAVVNKDNTEPKGSENGLETVIVDGKQGAGNATNDNSDDDADTEWLKSIEIQFEKIAGKDGVITVDLFKKVTGSKESYFNEGIFKFFDRNGNGSIDVEELKTGLRKLVKGTFDEKLRVLFNIIDTDGNGALDFEEMSTLLKSCVSESSFHVTQDDIESLTALLFERADQDNNGRVTFGELKSVLEGYPSILDNLTVSISGAFSTTQQRRRKKSFSHYFTKSHIMNNISKISFYIFYVVVTIALGSYSTWKYRESNGFTIVARICGMNLNFNGAFVLVLMLRKSLTLLRMTKVGSILPIDHHIYLHKFVGVMIVIFAVLHTGAHIGNAVSDASKTSNSTIETWEVLFTTKAGVGWVYGSAYITGWILVVVLSIMAICSMPFVRRKGHFQVFYWTHVLYIAFWILCILHGPIFWGFLLVPGIIFIIEKISRTKVFEKLRLGDIYIEEITLLPSGVIHLEISRPRNFHYQPGDYLFLNIPEIAQFEWHPFTISSAPEMTDRIWLHIRSAGNWTKQLYAYFKKFDPGEETTVQAQNNKFDEIQKRRRSVLLAKQKTVQRRRLQSKRMSSKKGAAVTIDAEEEARQMRIDSKTKKAKLKCHIDGPYGSPTREIFSTEHAILIGAGIGVTPMASILQSALYRYKSSNQTCPNCQYTWHGKLPDNLMKTKKIDFIWINRDQRSFEWFFNLMARIEAEQKIDTLSHSCEKLIDMQMFVTSAKKKTDLMGISLEIAMDLMYEKSHKSVVTGLETKSSAGRPDWKQVFTEIAAKKKGKVKVFFCGAPQLGVSIKEASEQFKFKFSKESF